MSLKKNLVTFCYYRTFEKGRRGEKILHSGVMGLCLEEGGPTHFHLGRRRKTPQFPIFFLAKAWRKSEQKHKRKVETAVVIPLSLYNFIKHYEQSFVSVCMKIFSCPLSLCTNHLFGKKAGKEPDQGSVPRAWVSACLWVWDLVSVLYMHSNVYCPLSSKSSDTGDWYSLALIISWWDCRKCGCPKGL